MAFSTVPNDYNLQLSTAYPEIYDAIVQRGLTPAVARPVAGTNIQSATLWSSLQRSVADLIDSQGPNDHRWVRSRNAWLHNVAESDISKYVISSDLWADTPNCTSQGPRRTVNGSLWQHGYHQTGDIIGAWLIQDMINALKLITMKVFILSVEASHVRTAACNGSHSMYGNKNVWYKYWEVASAYYYDLVMWAEGLRTSVSSYPTDTWMEFWQSSRKIRISPVIYRTEMVGYGENGTVSVNGPRMGTCLVFAPAVPITTQESDPDYPPHPPSNSITFAWHPLHSPGFVPGNLHYINNATWDPITQKTIMDGFNDRFSEQMADFDRWDTTIPLDNSSSYWTLRGLRLRKRTVWLYEPYGLTLR